MEELFGQEPCGFVIFFSFLLSIVDAFLHNCKRLNCFEAIDEMGFASVLKKLLKVMANKIIDRLFVEHPAKFDCWQHSEVQVASF
jgi:hypothetical protein